MHIDLSDEQADALRAVLDITMRDRSYEIASADLPKFRLTLRRQRAALQPILDAVGGPIPVSERFSPRRSAPSRRGPGSS